MPKRILVVEGDSALSRVLCDNFAFDGFEVLAVGEGDDAMEAVRTFGPDLVVVDIERGGADAAFLMASLRQEHSTPVLMLSTQGRRPPVAPLSTGRGGERATVAGVSELLPKPFDLDDLLERARTLLALPALKI
jgi:DNA-binding response OmpR family regulator